MRSFFGSSKLSLLILLCSRGDPVWSKFVKNIDTTTDIGGITSNNDSTTTTCPLTCLNGSTCSKVTNVLGDEEWKCLCPAGYTGESCDRLRRRIDETCNIGANQDFTCLHQGTCPEGHDTWYPMMDDETDALCDCSGAEEISAAFETTRYAGKTCEYPIEPDEYCARDKDLFCLNEGTCRAAAVDFDLQPCKCEEGYRGRHCEYHKNSTQEECVLTCSGVGRCEHGISPHGDVGANDKLELPNQATFQYMHCVCDDGYAGTKCEYNYIKCEGRAHYCFHGSTCITEGDKQECECESGNGYQVAGEFCEYKATDKCDDPTIPTKAIIDEAYGMTTAQFPFCVNNGDCVKDPTTDLLHCECKDDLYEGKRCESKIVPSPAPNETPAPTMAWTDTWEPTIEGSVTEFPTSSSEPSSSTDYPTSSFSGEPSSSTDYPTVWDSSTSTMDDSEPDNVIFKEKEPAALGKDDGGKFETEAIFGVTIVVLVSFSILAIAVVRYRRNARFIERGAFSEDEYNVGAQPSGEDMDGKSFEMTSSAPASSTGGESLHHRHTANGGVVEDPDSGHVELV